MKKLNFILLIVIVLMDYGCEQATESDTTPPDISISSPANGTTVSDTVTIKALVADNEGVKSVEFYIDGDLLTTDSEAPYEAVWITNDYTNGSHTLHCKAIDESDNEALSESIQVTVSNIILTAAFTEDWLCPSCGEGILFYSDMDGNLLWASTWSGNESIEILPTTEVPGFPDRVMVTTIKKDIRDNIFITTNMNVKSESWTWKGVPYWDLQTLGDVSLDLQNIPDHQGYIVASKWHRKRTGSQTISSPYLKSLLESPDNIFLRLNTNANGPQYMWIENVTPGGTETVDLSNLSPLSSKVVSLPTTDEEIYFSIRAFLNQDYYAGYYDIDISYNYDQSSNTVTAYYPTGLFDGYRTRLYINEEPYPTYNYWGYWIIGNNIPDEMQKMDADFEFISTDPDNFEIQITGEYNGTGSFWIFDDGTNTYKWRVFGTLQNYTLPELPSIVDQYYPGLNRVSFSLENTSINYRPAVIDNDHVMQILFQSDDLFYDVVHESFARTKDPDGLRP